MLHFSGRQGLSECVGHHIIGGAVNEVQGSLLDDPVDEVISYINMLCACMVLVVLCKGNCCLIVREKGGS